MMIPRRFFWIFDFAAASVSFLSAYILVLNFNALLSWSRRLNHAFRLFFPNYETGGLPSFGDLMWILLIGAPVTIIVLAAIGNHDPIFQQSRTRIVVGSVLAPATALALITLALFALRNPNWSRLFLFSFTILTAAALAAYRMCFWVYDSRRRTMGLYAKNVLLLGSTGAIEWMDDYFKHQVSAAEYRLFGYLLLRPDDTPAETDLRLAGTVDHLGTLLINEPIHEVIVLQPSSEGEWLPQVIQDCDYFGVVLRIVPEALLAQKQRAFKLLYPLSPLNLPAIVLAPPHWNSEALFLKHVLDVILSAALLVILSPLFLAIALAIKATTPGMSVFYKWRVVGRNGVEFTGYKFTTMISNADQLKQELQDQNEMQGPVFKIKNDPRITPLGKFLRKYSLNELPQLWSVVKGDMSLVGPRPAFRHELERYEFWHKRKLSIRPGITCLWQIRGRNRIVDFDDWVRMDLEYIDNWSLWLDFKILVKTAWVVVAGTGS